MELLLGLLIGGSVMTISNVLDNAREEQWYLENCANTHNWRLSCLLAEKEGRPPPPPPSDLWPYF